MSGGSMGHLYRLIEDAEFQRDTPLRVSFAKHLRLIAKALHDIEWVDSDDASPGSENRAIVDAVTDASGVAGYAVNLLTELTRARSPARIDELMDQARAFLNGLGRTEHRVTRRV